MHDPTLWQPLALDRRVAQNGLAVPGKVQTFIGANWGHVTRLRASSARAMGVPSTRACRRSGRRGDAYKQAAVDVIRMSGELDPADGATIDIGPARGATTRSGRTTARLHGEPGDGRAVWPEPRCCEATSARARRVLGRRPAVRDAARALERARERGLGLARASRRIGPGPATSRLSGT